MGAASAADNLTETSEDMQSEGNELNIEDINDKIDNTSDGDVIEIKASGEVSRVTDLSINKSVTLKGSGDDVVIRGSLSLHTDKGDIAIENLKFENMRYMNNFITNNANLTVRNCNFLDTSDPFLNNGILTLIDCSFKDFLAIYMNNNGNLRMENCRVDSTYALTNNGNLSVEDCEFVGSDHQIENYGKANISNSRFDNRTYLFNYNNANFNGCNFTSTVQIKNKADLSIRKIKA